jgi:hypothetical protein
MANPPRGILISRRCWLLAGLGTALLPLRARDALAVSFDGDNLHVSDGSLHFLSGKPLERMKDGAAVAFLSQLTLFSDAWLTVLRRSPVQRFVASYDIWGEGKFSVMATGISTRPAAGLSLEATEGWCMENMAISADGLPPDRPFWLRLEMRTGDPKDLSRVLSDPGISLKSLVVLLGRKGGTDDPQWMRETGPFRLANLTRTPGRGARSG